MADSEDLKRVLEGHIDLRQCDLRDADLSNKDLRGRDFEGAVLEGANFSGSDVSGSSFLSAKVGQSSFKGANCTVCKFDGALFRVNFEGADLRKAQISGLLVQCNLNNADLRGANFRKARFDENNKFTDVQYDEETDFEGVVALRPLSRLRAFEFFEYDLGKFSRKKIS
jgi:uncharacterized protein YjbI with pentapeptide repeats